jgi:hypothetical protein
MGCGGMLCGIMIECGSHPTNPAHPMKEIITSLLRHSLTALAGLGAFLAANHWIAPEDARSVDAAGATIADALLVVLVAVIARLLIKIFGIISQRREEPAIGKNDQDTFDGGASGGVTLLLLSGTAAAFLGSLPSCSSFPPPFSATVHGPGYSATYSEAGVQVHAVIPTK